MKIKAILAAVGLALGLAGGAQAATVSSQFFSGFQQLSDNSAELLINASTPTAPALVDTTVDVGDTLFGIFNIQTIEQTSSTHDLGVAGVDELTGVFAIQVVSKDSFGVNGCTSVWCFTFGASSAVIPELGNQTLASAYGANTLAALFSDTTPDYIRQGCTLAGCVDTADDGSLYMTLGFGSNGFWQATALTDNIALIGSLTAPNNGGTFNSALNIIINNSGLQFGTVACTNLITFAQVHTSVCGSGSLLGTGGATTPFDSFDNVDFTINRIPEPSSVALLGLGLLTLAGMIRRRRS